jgi:hypothetical protein
MVLKEREPIAYSFVTFFVYFTWYLLVVLEASAGAYVAGHFSSQKIERRVFV